MTSLARTHAPAWLLALLIFPAACSTDTGPEPRIAAAVKERRDNYRHIGESYKLIKESLESGEADVALVTRSARFMRETGERQPALFLPGSGQSSGAKTRARDNVWSESALFARRHADFLAAAEALSTAAPADLSLRYESLTQACLDCHQDFRERR